MIFSGEAERPNRSTPRPGVAVSYWLGELALDGAEDFRAELKAAYEQVSVESERGGLGGGLYTLFVEIGALVTLPHVVQLILDGIAFDLVKLGAEKLILRPLLAAQRKLKQRNRVDRESGNFAYLRIKFVDSEVVLDADSRVDQSITESLGKVLLLIAQNYQHLSLADGRTPIQVYTPLIEDTGRDRRSRFRAVLEVDEDMPLAARHFSSTGVSVIAKENAAFTTYDAACCSMSPSYIVVNIGSNADCAIDGRSPNKPIKTDGPKAARSLAVALGLLRE